MYLIFQSAKFKLYFSSLPCFFSNWTLCCLLLLLHSCSFHYFFLPSFLCPMSNLLFLFMYVFSISISTHSSRIKSSQSHKASSHAVRFRVCQLINKLLGSMAENAQIDDDLFDRIHQAMLVRVTDKFPNVRIQAALAMTRLQQPQDPDCPTINGLFLS